MTEYPSDKTNLRRITDEYEGYEFKYPQIAQLTKRQLEENLWFSSEMKVELDAMCLNWELSESQRHYVLSTLPLFIRYELYVGNFWTDVYTKTFPAPECVEAASVVNMVEIAIHARFYRQLAEALKIDTDSHFMDYLNTQAFVDRDAYLRRWLKHEDGVMACLAYSVVEGVLLFQNFLGLRSFQMNGSNLLPVIVRGTIQSSMDEDLHSEILTTTIATYYNELGMSIVDDEKRYEVFLDLLKHCHDVEMKVIDATMLENSLNGVTKQDMREYVQHRINVLLQRLGAPALYVVDSKVAKDFEKSVVGYKLVDFFTAGVGSEYTSNWSEQGFIDALVK